MLSMQDVESFVQRVYAGKNVMITPYAYNTTFPALSQNQTLTNTVNIQANADFIMLGIRARAQIGAAQTLNTVTAPFVRTLITDNGSNEQFTNQSVDLLNYGGNAQLLNDFPYPRIVQGRTSLNVVVSNYAPTAETYTSLDIMLVGVQVRAF